MQRHISDSTKVPFQGPLSTALLGRMWRGGLRKRCFRPRTHTEGRSHGEAARTSGFPVWNEAHIG